ncbi:hypothetical protein SRABI118_01300 [Massilia sp. Bi118]|uniref:hypothetical protein n=1 Tax=Massilia sp. Bi118 TaxID=2822346 RepID=UPI001DC5036A|nr:hypothetical protein [Massilia sp. Bi118]CAH0183250.1 hypothetical protein SRABI118_01300 [Massilia sp. Bi118]
MTSTLIIGPEQQGLEGRTVRDIVEHDPAQVNEVWCRKIFRQILQSLELQYAVHAPRQAITPDTVVFHGNGEPKMLPTELADSAHDEAADMTALARVVHFAITRELIPAGPLRGRKLEGYSDSLVTAVDRCMAGDPAERPQTIDELRDILGIVSLGPVAPAIVPLPIPAPVRTPPPAPSPTPVPLDAPFATAAQGVKVMSATVPAAGADMSIPMPVPVPAPMPTSMPTPTPIPVKAPSPFAATGDAMPSFMREPAPSSARIGGLSRWQRWAIAAGGGALLLAVALALFAELRDSGSYDHIVLTLPQSGEQARSDAASAPPPLAQAELQASASAAALPGNSAGPLASAGSGEAVPQAAAMPGAPVRGPVSAPTRRGVAPSATYRLQIQPWGVVYVDGVDRGVSPPVKRLVLAPGKHTIRIANPNFHDRVLEVDTSGGGGQIAVDFSDERR